MPVTIKEIAEKSGYSVPTVSQVLNDKGDLYRQETRDKIWDVARQLGYRPNAYRWAIRTGRFNAIGLVMSANQGKTSPFQPMFKQLHQELRERDMHLTVGEISDEVLIDTESMPKILREWAADGLLIDYIENVPQPLIQLLSDYHIPTVFINVKLPHDAVYPDDFDATKRATEELLALGHTRIAYATHHADGHYSIHDRRDGYRTAMTAAALEPVIHTLHQEQANKIPAQDRLAFAQTILRNPDQRPTAIVTYENDVAMPFITAATQLNLTFPDDLSLVTIHDSLVDSTGIAIHTYRIPAPELAIEGLKILFDKIENGDKSVPSLPVPHARLQGETIGPPRT